MILMLPAFYEQAVNDRCAFDKTYITQKVQTLFASHGLAPKDIFDKNSDYIKALGSNPFAAETPISLLAKDWTNKLKSLSSCAFDPLA